MNPISDRTNKNVHIIYGIIIIIPFLVFYWMTPFLSSLTIGNDYVGYPIREQMELMFSLKQGSYPLYVPGHGGGNSSSALTLGQIFHPISFIASVLPGYWTGNALEINTLLRLISLGFTQLMLFIFLRKLKTGNIFSFVISFITVYNLRMLDLFRYGASLENYTAFILLCISIAWYYINPSRLQGPICIIGTTYLLICGGHPQMMYYGLVGAGLLTLIFPYYLPLILSELDNQPSKVLKFYLQVLAFCFIGALLSSAYILPFYFDFLVNNGGRVGQGYRWSLAYQDLVSGVFNNFFRPLDSNIHGAFGGSSLIIAAGIMPLLYFFKVAIPMVILVLWGCLLCSLLYMMGSHFPIHYYFWKYFPLASSFRVPGRVSFILPVLIMLLLAWLVSLSKINFRFLGKEFSLYPYGIMAFLGLSAYIFYNCFLLSYLLPYFSYFPEIAYYSSARINAIPPWVTILIFLTGSASFITIIFYSFQSRNCKIAGFLLCAITCIQTGAVLRYGTWLAFKQNTPNLAKMKSDKQKVLTFWHSSGSGMYSKSLGYYLKEMLLHPTLAEGHKPYFLFSQEYNFDVDLKSALAKVYGYYTVASSNAEAYGLLEHKHSPDNVIVEGCLPQTDFEKVQNAKGIKNITDSVNLSYSSFNRLDFVVSSAKPAFFVLSYPYDSNWRAYVNSRETKIYRANGIEQAVRIPGGSSQIEFRYWSPAAFWGMLVSCMTLWLLSSWVSANFLFGNSRYLSILTITVLMIGIFWLWNQSLYSGDNLGTQYVWTSGNVSDSYE